MRRAILASLLFLPVIATAGTTREVLVLTSATKVTSSNTRRGTLIENRGPNAIWCAFTAASDVVNKSHKVAADGGLFPFNSPDAVYCIAETAAQVTGAATVVSEVE
jgi:hypothetical protein